jgi:hypothetical protein
MTDDTDSWLAALRGKPTRLLPPPEQQQIEALRETIAQTAESTPVRHDGPRELDRLLFRLRKERLLGAPSTLSWRRPFPMAAAAVVVCGVVFTMLRAAGLLGSGELETPPIIRGAHSLQILDVEDPQKAVTDTLARLNALEIPAQRYEVGQSLGVSATVPAARIKAASAALAPLDVALPADGELRVEFRRKTSQR